jgi:hypothetical protein
MATKKTCGNCSGNWTKGDDLNPPQGCTGNTALYGKPVPDEFSCCFWYQSFVMEMCGFMK